MKSLYINGSNGISGNSLVGAFISLGLDVEFLRREIAKLLEPDTFRLITHRRASYGKSLVYFDTETLSKGKSTDRISAPEAMELVHRSKMDPEVKNSTEMILNKLFESKAKAHEIAIQDVRFIYEGMNDTLIDTIGVSLGMKVFNIEKVVINKVNTGQGEINIGNHKMQIPAPMTKILLANHTTYHDERIGELTTPTGASIVASFADTTLEVLPEEYLFSGYGLPTGKRHDDQALQIGINHRIEK